MKCLTPAYVKNPLPLNQRESFIAIPCGKCVHCVKNKTNEWCFRILQETREFTHHSFLTLTYSDENLVYGRSLPTLSKRDCQLFFKRLRKSGHKFKYYIAGEYGCVSLRPHYHAIILHDGITNEEFTDHWQYGHVHFGSVKHESIYYTLKYIRKDQENIPDGVEPPFALMSKGMGKQFYEKNKHHMLSKPDSQFVWFDHIKIAIPHYFRKLLFREFPEAKSKFIKSTEDETDFETEQEFNAIVEYNRNERKRETQVRNSI